MKEYLVDWNPTKVNLLNEKVPELLKDTMFDIRFELEPTKLEVSTPNGTFYAPGQPQVKIVIENTTKEYFTYVLQNEGVDENFPKYLENYIAAELGVSVYSSK